jgi:predicted RNA-binding Zn-ribbon protein involved in translation (DUF1610 family)
MKDIEAIERLKALGRMFDEAPTGAIAKAIEALEKQVPKLTECIEPFEKYECPSCGEMYNAAFDDETGEPKIWFNYCPECGQAVISKD